MWIFLFHIRRAVVFYESIVSSYRGEGESILWSCSTEALRGSQRKRGFKVSDACELRSNIKTWYWSFSIWSNEHNMTPLISKLPALFFSGSMESTTFPLPSRNFWVMMFRPLSAKVQVARWEPVQIVPLCRPMPSPNFTTISVGLKMSS